MNEEELNLEPVEIHPENYSTNLFGEKVVVKKEDEEDLIGPKARAEFNIWALTDAIGARKKRDAWVLFQKALASGMVAEEVFYKLVWQVKTMLVASNTTSAAEADMKAFPYNKAKANLKNFKPGELEQLSQNLVLGYHRARRGEGERYKDLSYSFETKSGALDISNEEVLELTKKVSTLADVKRMIEEVLSLKRSYRISRILEIILASALSLKASDVHLEPEESRIRLRYRLDGVLTDILYFDKETFELLVSRIKLVSELKLNIHEKAQDGRFSIKLVDTEIEVRTSLLPGPNGESVVLRVLNPDAINVELDKLGIHPKLLEIVYKEIRKPNGMILTTGPTGSGKTTTLYAFLKRIYTPDIKVITIENPIEYHIEGIVQTQAQPDKGYDFAEGLRSALRQDPDVIMVGEIRDSETAETAVNAALTGHLVLSTLHTNNAAGSFPRLLDLGVNPKVISSALNISIAQRLVRTLCPKCKKEVPLVDKAKETVERVVASIEDKSYLEGIQTKIIWAPVGCSECSGLGYKGRIGVYEAILVDNNIEKVAISNPSERDIREAAKSQKLLTLEQDGVLKALLGVTTLDELDRVIDLSV